jgi:magnesium-transporting ATPase (P-type)
MGSGCTLAKEASDIILLSDDLSSVHRAALWGRNIYDGIRKFI